MTCDMLPTGSKTVSDFQCLEQTDCEKSNTETSMHFPSPSPSETFSDLTVSDQENTTTHTEIVPDQGKHLIKPDSDTNTLTDQVNQISAEAVSLEPTNEQPTNEIVEHTESDSKSESEESPENPGVTAAIQFISSLSIVDLSSIAYALGDQLISTLNTIQAEATKIRSTRSSAKRKSPVRSSISSPKLLTTNA